MPAGSELEFLQEGSRLVQSVLWTGALAEHPDQRTATLLPEGRTLSGLPEELPLAETDPEAGEWLVEPRPALERAGLIATALKDLPERIEELAPGLGLLRSRQPVAAPWFRNWRVHAVLPLREKPVKAWLRAHDGGEVVARTRGGVIEVDRWARTLRAGGDTRWVLFGLRLGMRTRAIIAQPED